MHESPVTLQEACFDFIASNISALCRDETSLDDGQTRLAFKTDDVFFHNNLSDQLLCSLCQKGKLNDTTLGLFTPRVTSLKRVKIKDAPLTAQGLRMLRSHKITELEAIRLKEVTVNELIGCLGEWAQCNLKHLNVSYSVFLKPAKYCVVVSSLRNLQRLNVSNTDFNEHGLKMIVEDLPALENLDISCTPITDLSPLRKCKDRLRSLSMYNLRASHNEDIVSLLCELTKLQHLDVSDDFSLQPFVNLQPVKFKVRELLLQENALPNLKSLDLSGKTEITANLLKEYLKSHPHLQFLGLALSDSCELAMFTDETDTCYMPNVTVTGDANEGQILESLRRYTNRSVYMQRSLYNLFILTQEYSQPKPNIIKLVLPGMSAHPKELGVQMAATACLYNLTKGETGQKIHPFWLAKVVELTMDAMRHFPNHQQLQKNALLTLCSDRILQEVTFDRFHCAKLVMECLCTFDDPSMNKMSVAICGILAAKIPTDQTSQLGASPSYMKKLLSIVGEKTQQQAADITLKFTLSALWNLTDESPVTCKMFVDEGGLELFLNVLQTYRTLPDANRVQVETKVLGLINNLAEVQDLRISLMTEDFISTIRELLRSEHIDVSYFAAGILSHLVSDGIETWTVEETGRQEMLRELGEAVMKWEPPEGEMVAYRSFSPFFPLLTHTEAPEVQLWAVWAMQHVCDKNASRYCPMLVKEGGAQKLRELFSTPKTEPKVLDIAGKILKTVSSQVGSTWTDEQL